MITNKVSDRGVDKVIRASEIFGTGKEGDRNNR